MSNATIASSSVVSMFDPLQINDHILIDGSIITYSPALDASEFAYHKLKEKQHLRVVSLGTSY